MVEFKACRLLNRGRNQENELNTTDSQIVIVERILAVSKQKHTIIISSRHLVLHDHLLKNKIYCSSFCSTNFSPFHTLHLHSLPLSYTHKHTHINLIVTKQSPQTGSSIIPPPFTQYTPQTQTRHTHTLNQQKGKNGTFLNMKNC